VDKHRNGTVWNVTAFYGGSMKKILQISILTLLAVTYLMIGLSYADTHTADSCSQAHVQAAIDAAARGDTVSIPAGSCTWSTNYTYETNYVYYGVKTTKAIKIVGAGSTGESTTTITEDMGTPSGTYKGYWLILYVPSSASDDANTEMEITGIIFDSANGTSIHAGAICMLNRSATAINKVKIHDNIFNNCYGGEASGTDYTNVIMREGTLYGVVYNNTFNGLPYIKVHGWARSDGGRDTWDSVTWSPGGTKALYFEDNTFNKNVSGASTHTLFSSGWGSAHVVRYNDITSTSGTLNVYNMHSIQRGGTYDSPTWYTYATMGGELYGNSITNTASETYPWQALGGRLHAFYNYVSNGTRSVRGIVSDTMSDTYAPTDNACTDNLYSGTGQPATACTTDHERQRTNKTYMWKNIKSSTSGALDLLRYTSTTYTLWGGNQITENLHYWKDNSSCSATGTCSSGIGCGSSAPTGNCSTGAAYWVTAQSCSDLSDMIGVDPTTPISGTLYRCGPANVWSVYYQPLAYPHPLRSTDPDPPVDSDAPSMTNPCAGSGTCTYPIIQIACDDLDDTEDILLGITATDYSQATTVCYYDTETRADYAAMAAGGHALTASGTSYTATAAGLACAEQHTFWYACSDGTNNTAVSNTSFVIAGRGDDTQAVITNIGIANQACAVQQKISINTDKPSTCKWSLTDEAYDDMDYTFSVTGGETGHVAHSTDVSQSCSETITRYIRCSTTQGVANTSSTSVSITTDAAKSVGGIGAGSLSITVGSGGNTLTIIP